MKLPSMLRRTRSEPLPLLPTARMEGRPSTWSGEKLERLLTPREIEQVLHGDL
ncbi:hypothetical protein [Rhodococcus sp. HNM0569]|uniref:hypothetical protein n=1 Tax=Rhodococcus sp. HNM0569 TaxID=2716340 RepID=UPI00146D0B9B|nr:hypothetical protein [Rhodococcus sp. HNM0569]NLU83130.1 hypothetical protein [Rhodococcus sp. HNM0569]